MKNKTTWQRPKTTKVYLQRPLSERIALLCPDFKLLSLPLQDNGLHVGQLGVGLLLLHGEEMVGFDLDETVFRPVECGIPIYETVNRGECLTKFEAFALGERNPTLYFRVTLENDSDERVESSIGLLPRSGQEKYMLNQHQEGYSPYRPNEKNWYMLKRTWLSSGRRIAESDMGQLYVDIDADWITRSKNGHSFAAADYFKIDYSLDKGESFSF